MKKYYRIALNWLAVLLWLGVIYYFSSQPNLKSELEPIWDLIFRKIAHLAEFFVLAYLLYRSLSSNGLKGKNLLLISFFLSLTFAVFDEWHQSQVAGRLASPVDVLVDSVGILFFVALQLKVKFSK